MHENHALMKISKHTFITMATGHIMVFAVPYYNMYGIYVAIHACSQLAIDLLAIDLL